MKKWYHFLLNGRPLCQWPTKAANLYAGKVKLGHTTCEVFDAEMAVQITLGGLRLNPDNAGMTITYAEGTCPVYTPKVDEKPQPATAEQ